MSNLAPLITLAVGGVVAVGTLLWYLFGDKEKCHKHGKGGSGGRSGGSGPDSFPEFVQYPRSPDPGSNAIKRKSTSAKNHSKTKSTAGSKIDQSSSSCVNTESTKKGSKSDRRSLSTVNNEITIKLPSSSKPDIECNSSNNTNAAVGVQLPPLGRSLESSHKLKKECQVCEKEIGVIQFQPCGHNPFCNEHAQYYWDLNFSENAKKLNIKFPKCPAPQCGQIIEKIMQ